MLRPLLKPVLSATLAVMTIGVVSLEIVVALFALEGGRAPSLDHLDYCNTGDDELWSQSNK